MGKLFIMLVHRTFEFEFSLGNFRQAQALQLSGGRVGSYRHLAFRIKCQLALSYPRGLTHLLSDKRYGRLLWPLITFDFWKVLKACFDNTTK